MLYSLLQLQLRYVELRADGAVQLLVLAVCPLLLVGDEDLR